MPKYQVLIDSKKFGVINLVKEFKNNKEFRKHVREAEKHHNDRMIIGPVFILNKENANEK